MKKILLKSQKNKNVILNNTVSDNAVIFKQIHLDIIFDFSDLI